ncbi:UNVERIFIED_CONTAM: hypothetical protein K2H54_042842 [Gekko kuhli]
MPHLDHLPKLTDAVLWLWKGRILESRESPKQSSYLTEKQHNWMSGHLALTGEVRPGSGTGLATEETMADEARRERLKCTVSCPALFSSGLSAITAWERHNLSLKPLPYAIIALNKLSGLQLAKPEQYPQHCHLVEEAKYYQTLHLKDHDPAALAGSKEQQADRLVRVPSAKDRVRQEYEGEGGFRTSMPSAEDRDTGERRRSSSPLEADARRRRVIGLRHRVDLDRR